MVTNRSWIVSIACVAVFTLTLASGARADEEFPPPYDPGVAPVYLIISLDGTFDDSFDGETTSPAQTLMVNIGRFVAGPAILDTRFAVNEALLRLPIGDEGQPTFEQIQQNDATVLGSFETTDLFEIHMVTPAPGEIPPDIQVAVFTASHEGDLDVLLSESPYPSTAQIAQTIAFRLPEGSDYDASAVQQYVFGSAVTLSIGSDDTAGGNGEMFPHDPNSPSIFHWSVNIAENGDFTSEFCETMTIDVDSTSRNGAVKLKNRGGTLKVAILTNDQVDVADLDPSTIEIDGVAPRLVVTRDFDHDGDDDLECHFRIGDLVDGGALSSTTTQLTLRADDLDGDCHAGTDDVFTK